MVGGLAPWHIAIVIVVVLLLFGSKKLPDAARGLGRSMRIFKSEMKEMQSDGKTEDPQALPQSQPDPSQFAQPQVHPQQAQPQPQQFTDPSAPQHGGQQGQSGQ